MGFIQWCMHLDVLFSLRDSSRSNIKQQYEQRDKAKQERETQCATIFHLNPYGIDKYDTIKMKFLI